MTASRYILPVLLENPFGELLEEFAREILVGGWQAEHDSSIA